MAQFYTAQKEVVLPQLHGVSVTIQIPEVNLVHAVIAPSVRVFAASDVAVEPLDAFVASKNGKRVFSFGNPIMPEIEVYFVLLVDGDGKIQPEFFDYGINNYVHIIGRRGFLVDKCKRAVVPCYVA